MRPVGLAWMRARRISSVPTKSQRQLAERQNKQNAARSSLDGRKKLSPSFSILLSRVLPFSTSPTRCCSLRGDSRSRKCEEAGPLPAEARRGCQCASARAPAPSPRKVVVDRAGAQTTQAPPHDVGGLAQPIVDNHPLCSQGKSPPLISGVPQKQAARHKGQGDPSKYLPSARIWGGLCHQDAFACCLENLRRSIEAFRGAKG